MYSVQWILFTLTPCIFKRQASYFDFNLSLSLIRSLQKEKKTNETNSIHILRRKSIYKKLLIILFELQEEEEEATNTK